MPRERDDCIRFRMILRYEWSDDDIHYYNRDRPSPMKRGREILWSVGRTGGKTEFDPACCMIAFSLAQSHWCGSFVHLHFQPRVVSNTNMFSCFRTRIHSFHLNLDQASAPCTSNPQNALCSISPPLTRAPNCHRAAHHLPLLHP